MFMCTHNQPLAQIARLLTNDGLVQAEEELSEDPTVGAQGYH